MRPGLSAACTSWLERKALGQKLLAPRVSRSRNAFFIHTAAMRVAYLMQIQPTLCQLHFSNHDRLFSILCSHAWIPFLSFQSLPASIWCLQTTTRDSSSSARRRRRAIYVTVMMQPIVKTYRVSKSCCLK
jgi:hypothetical protein